MICWKRFVRFGTYLLARIGRTGHANVGKALNDTSTRTMGHRGREEWRKWHRVRPAMIFAP
jgi:hypothetical protein